MAAHPHFIGTAAAEADVSPLTDRPSHMLAAADDKNDVTIHWPSHLRRRIARILASGQCPSYRTPRGVRVPGGLVVLVDEDGSPLLRFRLRRIADCKGTGSDDFRCMLIAKAGTMRRPNNSDRSRYPVNSHAEGAFAYFDDRSGSSVIYSDVSESDTASPGMRHLQLATGKVHRFLADTVGRTLEQPERELISAYGRWLAREDALLHQFMPSAGVYTDLIIRPRYTLVEAKAHTHREALRTALGQLFDYQRYFLRHPRLAILVPRKLDATMEDLFAAKRVSVIWRSTGGSFVDSADGAFTTQLRDDGSR